MLAELAFKKIKDELTKEEEQELAGMFEQAPQKKAFFEELIDPVQMAKQIRIIDELDVDACWNEFEQMPDATAQA